MRRGALEIGTEREQLLTLRLSKRGRTPRNHVQKWNFLQVEL
jgi:hypothetical protein